MTSILISINIKKKPSVVLKTTDGLFRFYFYLCWLAYISTGSQSLLLGVRAHELALDIGYPVLHH